MKIIQKIKNRRERKNKNKVFEKFNLLETDLEIARRKLDLQIKHQEQLDLSINEISKLIGDLRNEIKTSEEYCKKCIRAE